MFELLRVQIVEVVESWSYQLYRAVSVQIFEIVQAINYGVFDCSGYREVFGLLRSVRVIKKCSGLLRVQRFQLLSCRFIELCVILKMIQAIKY